jgi:uncharacterized membrane protein
MKKLASDLMFALLVFMVLGAGVVGILHYQEGTSGGMIVAIVSFIVFYLLIITPKEN